jgi:hypothetical protein
MTDSRIQGSLVHLVLPPNTAPLGDASQSGTAIPRDGVRDGYPYRMLTCTRGAARDLLSKSGKCAPNARFAEQIGCKCRKRQP